jgi:hypothetical protein
VEHFRGWSPGVPYQSSDSALCRPLTVGAMPPLQTIRVGDPLIFLVIGSFSPALVRLNKLPWLFQVAIEEDLRSQIGQNGRYFDLVDLSKVKAFQVALDTPGRRFKVSSPFSYPRDQRWFVCGSCSF